MSRRLLVLLTLFAFAAHADTLKHRAANPTRGDIVIGGLFSLTGDGATLGAASAAALDLAARDINREFDDLGIPYHVVTSVEDTKLTPSVAAAKIELLASRAATFVIGPQSSAEAAPVREWRSPATTFSVSRRTTSLKAQPSRR